jgi:hypothetical protein
VHSGQRSKNPCCLYAFRKPEVCCAESGRAVRGPCRPALVVGKQCPPPNNLDNWLRSGCLGNVMTCVARSVSQLLTDSLISISHDVDFGVVDLSSLAPLSEDVGMALRSSQAILPPEAVRSSTTVHRNPYSRLSNGKGARSIIVPFIPPYVPTRKTYGACRQCRICQILFCRLA